MNTDQFILLVNSQWERGLIVPDCIEETDPLMDAASSACAAGLVKQGGYQVTSGHATCFSLTRKGWLRVGELVNAEVLFR